MFQRVGSKKASVWQGEQLRKRLFLWQLGFVALLLLIAGQCPGRSAQAAGDWKGAQKAVIKAYRHYQVEVNVESYQLNYATEHDQLKAMMNEVVSETPYLFYTATRFSVVRNTSTNQIVKILLGYEDDYLKSDGSVRKKKIKNTRIKLDAAVSEAMTVVKPEMKTVEKVMVLHDYLVSNVEYTKDTSKTYRVTEVGVFLRHKANCTGYSRAFSILMEKAGVPVRFVSSDKQDHMWNQVQLGKQWYHVDVTWDDPLDALDDQDQYGFVSHKNFLCSDEQIKLNGHTDYKANAATDTKYDKKYWRSVNSSFYYSNGKWIYMTKKGILQRDRLAGGRNTIVYNVKGAGLVCRNENQYYFISDDSIYCYDYVSGEAHMVWKASDHYAQTCKLDQIKVMGNTLYYKILDHGKHINNTLSIKADGTV